MTKYLLNAPHYINEQYLEEGTVVGEGTLFPVSDDFVPSRSMSPLDDAAKSAFEERFGEGAQDPGARNVNFRPLSISGMEVHPSFRDGAEDQGQEPKRRDRPEEDSGGRVSPVYASQLAIMDVMDSRYAGENPGDVEIDPEAPEPRSPAEREQEEQGSKPNETDPPVDNQGGQSMTDPGGRKGRKTSV